MAVWADDAQILKALIRLYTVYVIVLEGKAATVPLGANAALRASIMQKAPIFNGIFDCVEAVGRVLNKVSAYDLFIGHVHPSTDTTNMFPLVPLGKCVSQVIVVYSLKVQSGLEPLPLIGAHTVRNPQPSDDRDVRLAVFNRFGEPIPRYSQKAIPKHPGNGLFLKDTFLHGQAV